MKDTYITRAILKDYVTIKEVDITFDKNVNIIIGKNGVGKTNFINYLADSLNKVPFFEISDASIYYFFEKEVFKKVVSNAIYVDDNFDIKENNSVEYFKGEEKVSSTTGNLLRYVKIKHGIPDNYYIAKDPISDSIKKNDKGYFVFSNHADSSLAFRIGVKYLLDVLINNNFSSENYDLNIPLENLKLELKKFSNIENIKIGENLNVNIINRGEIHFSNLYLEFLVNDNWLLFNQLSDGTKRLFYIISEIVLTNNTIVLLEEPELGLHPHQLHKLMDFIKEKSEHLQFIITTHSPLVLNILNKDELDSIIIAKFEDGQTKLVHLTDEQKHKAQLYMEDLDLSDYWVHSDLED